MLNASDHRKNAWSALEGKWGFAIGVGLVAGLLGGGELGKFSIDISGDDLSDISETLNGLSYDARATISVILFLLISVGICVSLAHSLLGSIVSVGYARFNLEMIDTRDSKFIKLFSFFPKWWKAILTDLLRNLFISLWMLLFIIPGIMAAYSYAMTPYILAEDPDISPSDAIRKSKDMMNGYRWNLFCLELSFIGWDLLCILTLGVLSIWVNPYKSAAKADFYREISGTRPHPEAEAAFETLLESDNT